MKLIHVVLDETASMSSSKAQTIEAYNKYLDSLPNDDCVLALTTFNQVKIEERHDFLTPAEAPRLNQENYRPASNTPLFDAIAYVIRKTEEFTAAHQRVIGYVAPVLIVVLTDGEENCSKEYDLEMIQKYMGDMEKEKQWEFAYLGVGPDGWSKSNLVAYVHTNSMARGQTVNSGDTRTAFASATDITAEYIQRRTE